MELRRVSHESTGRYRCEVSAEAPAFHTVSNHADMTVVGEYTFTHTLLMYTHIYTRLDNVGCNKRVQEAPLSD